MISVYNGERASDVLPVIVADDQGAENQIRRAGDVARVSLVEALEAVVTWNIFSASTPLDDTNGTGQITLTDEQIEKVSTAIKDARFSETLEKDGTLKTVVGFVKSCRRHPNSGHLSITQTEVDNGGILQIVCDTPNIKAEQEVVMVKPGAVMPDGLMIWSGVLRREESFGMICSAKELRLPDASAKKGILELPFDAGVGPTFATGG